MTKNFLTYMQIRTKVSSSDSISNFSREIASLLELTKNTNDVIIYTINSATDSVYSNILKNTKNPITEEIYEDTLNTSFFYFQANKCFDGLNAYLNEWDAFLSGKLKKQNNIKKSNSSNGQAI